MQDPEGFQPGDKVRIRRGEHAGARGILRGEVDDLLQVELVEGGSTIVSSEDVTNYSLAARKAWVSMPKRSGRPPSTKPAKKMVSIRLDVDVWEALGQAAESGLIQSREQAVNGWLKQMLAELTQSRPEIVLNSNSPQGQEVSHGGRNGLEKVNRR